MESSIFNILFALFFALIVGGTLFVIVQAVRQYVRNKNSPVLERPARVIAKRSEVSQSSTDSNNTIASTIRTTYYVTFESETGERGEWDMTGEQFGLLVEGDRGVLVTQGTWFKDFRRTAS